MTTDLACKSFEYDNEAHWFQMMLKCNEFPSVNSAHGYKLRGETSARVFDQPWVVQFRSEIRDQLIIADPKRYCPWIVPSATYYLCIKYIIKSYFWNRDLDNMVKIFQDEIAQSVHINDSHIIEEHTFKAFKPGDFEYAIIRFGISDYDYNEFTK